MAKRRHEEEQTSSSKATLMGMSAAGLAVAALVVWALTRTVQPVPSVMSETPMVVEQPATLTWGRPAPSAERVATFMGQPERAAIFGYPRLAAMVVGRAPARRVGFFAADDAAASLTTEGVRLLAAAVNWVLRPS